MIIFLSLKHECNKKHCLTGGRVVKTSADISRLGTLIQKLFILFLLCAAMAVAKHNREEAACYYHDGEDS